MIDPRDAYKSKVKSSAKYEKKTFAELKGIKIVAPHKEFEDGSQLDAKINNAVRYGFEVQRHMPFKGLGTLPGFTEQDELPPNLIAGIIALRALNPDKLVDVYDYPAFLEVDLNAEVPEGFPGRSIEELDEDGNVVSTTVRTWQQWTDANNQQPKTIDGVTYVKLIDPENSGKYMPASFWASFVPSGKVKSMFEIQASEQANSSGV